MSAAAILAAHEAVTESIRRVEEEIAGDLAKLSTEERKKHDKEQAEAEEWANAALAIIFLAGIILTAAFFIWVFF